MKEALLFFMQGIPEVTGFIAFSLAIARVPVNWGKTIFVATIMAITSYVLRALSFFFGLHTLMIMFLIMFYISRTGNVQIVKSFLVTFAGAITLGVLEYATNTTFFLLTGMTQEDLMYNQFLWAMLGMPQVIIIILLSFIVSRAFKPERKGF